MNVILGLNGAALRDPALTADTRDKLEKLGQSGRHLMGLINNILNMNHIGGDSLEISHEPFSMADSLAQVDAIAKELCDEKDLTYRAVLRDGALGWYLGDAIRLRQVLISILENAVKYTDAPGTVTLSVDADEEKDGFRPLRFAVSDTGIGIDSDFLPKVFSPFEREDESSTTRFGGTGVSLAVTKNTVELMGGTISVESEKGVGSTFTVMLPFCPAPEECGQAAPAETDVSLAGKHILIVEDLPENAEIVQDLLELEGASSDHAENGQVGLDMFDRSRPNSYDAILMDLRMPVMDGLEATRRIRALPRPDAKTVPIIALTANAFESDIQASMDAGMDAHLSKPTDTECLYATLRHLIADSSEAKGGGAP
jgi:CheY-like chemotaxis protein